MTVLLAFLRPRRPRLVPPLQPPPPPGAVTLACGTCEVQWDGQPGELCWQCDPPGQGWPAVPEVLS